MRWELLLCACTDSLTLSSMSFAEMMDGSSRCESEGVAHWDWPWIHCALLGNDRRVYFFLSRGPRPRSKPSEEFLSGSFGAEASIWYHFAQHWNVTLRFGFDLARCWNLAMSR